MIAEVIPRLRLVRGLNRFDYEIPSGLSITAGDIVLVPWRKSRVAGAVARVKKTSRLKRLRAIEKKIFHIQLQKEFLDALFWFSKFYYVSEALSLKQWLPDIPKKNLKSAKKRQWPSTLSSEHPAIPSYVKAVLETIKKRTSLAQTVVYNNSEDKYLLYRSLFRIATGKMIIICPTIEQVRSLAEALKHFQPALLSSTLSKGAYWRSWVAAADPLGPRLIIGTKQAIFTLPPSLEYLIVDDEESPHHKNYDQNPRYRVHDVAEHIFKALPSCQLLYLSRAPRVTTAYHSHISSMIRPEKKNVTIVDMDSSRSNSEYAFLSQPLAERIGSGASVFLFFNRVGLARFLVCRQCKTLYKINEVTRCRMCQSMDFFKAGFGTQKIFSELNKLFPDISAAILDREHRALPQEARVIIGTEFALEKISLPSFDCLGLLSVDQLVTSRGWRGTEVTYQQLRFFLTLGPDVYVQTYNPENPTLVAAVSGNYHSFYEHELRLRKSFGYPPFSRLMKIIDPQTRQTTLVKDSLADFEPPKNALIDINPD